MARTSTWVSDMWQKEGVIQMYVFPHITTPCRTGRGIAVWRGGPGGGGGGCLWSPLNAPCRACVCLSQLASSSRSSIANPGVGLYRLLCYEAVARTPV